jgi:hypothetical protein
MAKRSHARLVAGLLLAFLAWRAVDAARRVPGLANVSAVTEGLTWSLEQRQRRMLAEEAEGATAGPEAWTLLQAIRERTGERAVVLAALGAEKSEKHFLHALAALLFPRTVLRARSDGELQNWRALGEQASPDPLYALSGRGEPHGWQADAERVAITGEHVLWRLPRLSR